ncbi:uncharacterized protein LOC115671420 [Syzygium oleosum]|uniref:uncharacterized protein LOC115671420 n=1 Tax=Syzygium oleosum TaxID=219896 RepID=UPI0011D2B7F9|nr:uncharacterized protein LOC115671420 [Syzygium oleosum]
MSSPDPQPSDSPSGTGSATLGSENPGGAADRPERNGGEEGAEEGDHEEEEEEGEEGEERECGFCLFMKGGGCRDAFVAWEVCVQDAEKNEEDLVDKCFDATAALRKCMDAHSDYYEPILRAEKAVEEEVARELEEEEEEEEEKKEKESEANSVAGSDDPVEGITRSEDSSQRDEMTGQARPLKRV